MTGIATRSSEKRYRWSGGRSSAYPLGPSSFMTRVTSTDPRSVLARITHTDTQISSSVIQRRQIAQIVARESAETLVGRTAGLRVEIVRRLIGPVANHVAGRFVTYDRVLGEGLR